MGAVQPAAGGAAGGRRPNGPSRNPLAGAARQSRRTRQWLNGGCQIAAELDWNGENFSHDTISHDFKMALQRARLAKKMGQAELALAINEKQSVVNDYESGKAIPNGPIINKLNRALGLRLPEAVWYQGLTIGNRTLAWSSLARFALLKAGRHLGSTIGNRLPKAGPLLGSTIGNRTLLKAGDNKFNNWQPNSCFELSGTLRLAHKCVHACDIKRYGPYGSRYRYFDDGLPCNYMDESVFKDERRKRRARDMLRDQHRRSNFGFGNRKPISHTRGLKREDKRLLRASATSGRPTNLSYAALRKNAASGRNGHRKAGGGRHKAGEGAVEEINNWLPDSCLELSDVLRLAHKWVHACDIKRYGPYGSRRRSLDDDLPCNYIDESWWKDERRERRARALLRDQRRHSNLGFGNRKTRGLKREDKRKFRTSATSGRPTNLSYAALRKNAASGRNGHRKAREGARSEAGQLLSEYLQDMLDASAIASELDSRTLDDHESTDTSRNVFHPGAGVDLRQKKDVDVINRVHNWHMVVEAGARLPKPSKRQFQRSAKRSTSFKAACTNVLDELQHVIRRVSTVLSIARVVHKMREDRQRFLRTIAPVVKCLRSRRHVSVQRETSPELLADEERGALPKSPCCPSKKLKVTGSIFKEPCTMGDFAWMLEIDVHPRALYVFNDNDADHHRCSRGGGNAAIRPYNRYNLHRDGTPRSAGISTGFSSALGGFLALDARARAIVDRDISEIKDLLSTGLYDQVFYSASSDGSGLGTGIFCVAPAVKGYIVAELNKFDGKTVAELMEHRAFQQAQEATTPRVSWAQSLIIAHDQLATLKDTLSAIDAILALLLPKCSQAALQQVYHSVMHLTCSVNRIYMSPSDMRSKQEELREKRRIILDLPNVANPIDGIWVGVLQRLFSEFDSKVRASLAQPESPSLVFSSVSDFFRACIVRAAWRYQPLLRRAFSCSKLLSGHATGSHWHIEISAAPVSLRVQESFYEAWSQMPDAMDNFKLAFHGTSCTNLSSICSRGLLIPGKDNSLQVRNGSVHGLGVYLANLNAVDLSLGFADAGNDEVCGKRQLGLLVCGVLDDALPCSDRPSLRSFRPSSFSVTACSKSVHHVGDALVVFDTSRVVPLFVVSLRRGPYSISMRTVA